MRGSRKALTAACIGSVVEWFDFGVYIYLAPIVAAQFFPSTDEVASLLGALAVFAVAFLMRPVGGFVLGHFGDKIGRRGVLAFSIITMATATFLIGALPSHAAVGIAAPLLLVVLRLVQGFSAGGEYMGAASFALEYAPAHRRGRYAGMLGASIVGGFLVAAVVVLGVTGLVGNAALGAWGWRIPFLVALPMGLVGLYLRVRLEDTPEFLEVQANSAIVKAPIVVALRTQRRPMLVVCGAALPFVVGIYLLLAYSPSFLVVNAGLTLPAALTSNVIALVFFVSAFPVVGSLIDRFGFRALMLAGSIGILVLAAPAFLVMGAGGLPLAVAGQVILAIPTAMFGTGVLIALVTAFPTRLRYSAGSISYNVAQAVFGGSAAYVATYLVEVSGSSLAPAWYLAALTLVSIPLLAGPFRKLARGEEQAAERARVEEGR